MLFGLLTSSLFSFRFLFKIFLSLLVCFLVLIFLCDYFIRSGSQAYLFNSAEAIPAQCCGVLLGTSPKLKDGSPNLFFTYRIQAAVKLFKAGKINYLIVSGDNGTRQYNEPAEMRKALVAAGVPDTCIYSDFAGFRTFDSMIRAREVFGQKAFVVISQPFHNERAVYIARKKGIEAYGYQAEEVSAYTGFTTYVREYFARVKVFLDLYLLGTEPTYLGEKVPIGKSAI